MHRTDYAAHDARYRQLRASGADGWDPADTDEARNAELGWAFAHLAPAGPRLVELGCGAGNHSRWFAERGFDVTGIDVSPTAIEWAAARGIPRARFLVGDLVAGIPGAVSRRRWRVSDMRRN
jgi:2-polyprenyl-3-methyl-5-hydroxy-6-metoxy-1,4-benzoquinol methylase